MSRRVALHGRDVAIMRTLLERRAETLDYMHETFFGDSKRKTVLNRLRRLELAGYLHRESLPAAEDNGKPVSVYTLGPKAKVALELRSSFAFEAFRGRRFNPTLRPSSMPHQLLTNRIGDWLGTTLNPEHLLPPPARDAVKHRPDATYEAATTDRQGRRTVFLEVDLGHYSRERILGKVKAFLADSQARSIVFAVPDRDRLRQLAQWIGDHHGEAVLGERVQLLTFAHLREGGWLAPGTEPKQRANPFEDVA